MRVLVVLADPIAPHGIRQRCSALVAGGHEVAICYVLPPPPSLKASLEAQRRITADLRQALASSAESIPVFVVSGSAGDGIDDCARDWGATDVHT
jgi:hypothetical protein